MVPEELARPMSGKIGGLVEEALNRGMELERILHDNGLTYEDLRYANNPKAILLDNAYRTLSEFGRPYHGTSVVSFFSGCGGLDLGFETAGFEHVALIENNEIFCDTLRDNRDWHVIGPPFHKGDVSKRRQILSELKNLNLKKNFDGIFVGGPPCQPFSIASNQRFSKNGSNFKRVGFEHETNGNLLFDYVWFIEKLLPKAFLIENVAGLMDVDGGNQLTKVYASLEKIGYSINAPLKLNAMHYAVPQQRERLFIIGYKGNKSFMEPKRNDEIVACIQALIGIDDKCSNHVTRKHKASSIARYIKLDVGKRDQLGRVDRLDPSSPSKTVIAGGSSGGGRSHLHPYIPRTLSVRESARLQTFPDNYRFSGSSARQFTQVGNAVPPILAAQLASSIFDSYFNKI